MVTIRKAALSDAERIAQIHVEAWRAAYHDFIPADFPNNKAKLESRREFWNERLTKEEEIHYVAENDGEIVGFFSIDQTRDADLSEKTYELIAIYFDAAYWHKGCGSQAMHFIIAQAKLRGYLRISLWVLEQNTAAIQFYKKFGFQFDGKTNVLPLGKPVTECRYQLELTEKSI